MMKYVGYMLEENDYLKVEPQHLPVENDYKWPLYVCPECQLVFSWMNTFSLCAMPTKRNKNYTGIIKSKTILQMNLKTC